MLRKTKKLLKYILIAIITTCAYINTITNVSALEVNDTLYIDR